MSERRNENIAPNLASKQMHQIMLHNSSLPATNQPHGNTSQQQQSSDMKVDPNGYQHESSRQKMAASSVYENLADSKLSAFSHSEDFQASKSAPISALPETIEMSVLQETTEEKQQVEKSDKSSICVGINNSNNFASQNSAFSVLPDSASSLSHSSHTSFHEVLPHALETTVSSFEPQPPSLSQATIQHQQLQDKASTKEDNDTAVQPLLLSHDSSISIDSVNQPARSFESRSDKDLYRYLLLGSNQECSHDRYGLATDNPENLFMTLTHSNTFPCASKVNGVSLDVYSESDEEDEVEVPYEKQLHISEEDLGTSDEMLENSLFLGVSSPSREKCREDWVVGLIPSVGLSRPGMRKYLSEEGPVYSRLFNKSIAILEDATRSRSLDEAGLGAESPDPRRMNSTMAGSPDVETYDNFLLQPVGAGNSMYAYDPNDDSSPWDGDMNRSDLSSQTAEDREKLSRLKDVLPDQQPIPV